MIEQLLSLSVAGLRLADKPADTAESLRATMAWMASLGCRAVQLNAAAAGLRPRDLDRSARRELASLLRRSEMACSGLDLWIPPTHFAQTEHVDRAAAAVRSALELAADLVGASGGSWQPAVSVTLAEGTSPAVLQDFLQTADRFNARLADHTWPKRASLPDLLPGAPLAAGLDPATVLAGAGDPSVEAARMGRSLAAARLSDLSSAGRVVPGEGRLDLMNYAVALSTSGYETPLVLDLRNVPDLPAAAPRAVRAWWAASPRLPGA